MALVINFQITYILSILNLYLIHCWSHSDSHYRPFEHGSNPGNKQVVFPVRLEWSGEFNRPHSLHKRDTFPSLLKGQDTSLLGFGYDHNVLYKIPAYGQDFLFHLSPVSDFISPNVVVEHMEGNFTWIEHGFQSNVSQCFFNGIVNNISSSRAVFSLCDGMTGLFHVQGETYSLEPCAKEEHHLSSANSAGHMQPHYIYKHTPNKRESQTSHCATSKDNYKHTRRKDNLQNNSLGVNKLNLFSVDSEQKLYFHKKNNNINHSIYGSNHNMYKNHRSKRSASLKRHVKVMVAADYGMYRYHGRDLERYILTLMGIVSSIYKDPSIGNFINIVLVKIKVFRTNEDGPLISENAHRTLVEFCQWQSRNNEPDNHPEHHDAAVLMTRTDICRTESKCETLGLAEIGTMCTNSSCAIIEDNGLSAAYTIAHELGHVFNVPHDDSKRCRGYPADPNVPGHVMAGLLEHNNSPWTWSKCSAAILTRFIDLGKAECLLTRPSRKKIYSIPTILPGQEYDINKQCELMFGRGFKLCPYEAVKDNECMRIWCTDSKNKGCRTLHTPWADGTSCGHNMWCRHGKCTREKPLVPQNGGWGQWEEYGECSRTCGGGIKKAIRQCNSPIPQNGGKYCTGRRVRYKSCNTKDCPPGGKDFREVQCAAHDNTPSIQNLRNVHWVPKYSGIRLKDVCKLYCKANNSSAYLLFSEKVIDGTKCGENTFDVCVNGKCRKAGCDNKLGSDVKIDRCGVCGGNNSSCVVEEIHSHFFNVVSYGYNYVTEIPAGAKNILIRQRGHLNLKADGNYLALKNSSGHYVLNGNKVVNAAKRLVPISGSVLEYSGSDSVIEQINSTGPIGENISVYLLSVGKHYPPNIEYSYTVTVQSHFIWSTEGAWSECDRLCEGTRTREVVCVSDDRARIEVSDRKCERQRVPKPSPIVERCNTECKLRWDIEEGECSTRCGEGIAHRVVRCIKRNIWNQDQEVEERHCDHLGPKPGDVVFCHGKCLPTHWQYGSWSECSQSCGGGTKTRTARCLDLDNSDLPEWECRPEDKEASRPCNTEPCPDWRTFPWTGCSHTCGIGTRHRKVYCYHGERKVADMYCVNQRKPTNTEKCNLPPCPMWTEQSWGSCSVTCGLGVSTREVVCRMNNGEILEQGICDPASRPYDTRPCNMGSCPTTTTTSTTTTTTTTTTTPTTTTTTTTSTTPTTTTTTTRRTTITTTSSTTTTTTPTTTTSTATSMKVLPARSFLNSWSRLPVSWKTSVWSPCSVTCGEGMRTRQRHCEDSYGRHQNDILCVNQEPPVTREKCLRPACGIWRSGDWGECSVSCGEGDLIRRVVCFKTDFPTVLPDEDCDQDEKPEVRISCNRGDCPTVKDYAISVITSNNVEGTSHWRVAPWTDCTSRCGLGYKRRQVVCQDERGPSRDCDRNRMPEDKTHCYGNGCGTWTYGMWSTCSITCGGDGEEIRDVTCKLNEDQIEDHLCNITERPPHRRPCNNGPCQTNRRWSIGLWSPCSVTCGRGQQRRMVHCTDEKDSFLPSSECPGQKPRNHRMCRMGRCPRWTTGRWTRCSVTCGIGIKVRDVRCKAKHFRTVDAAFCNAKKKPKSVKPCERKICTDFNWKKGLWSQCSKTCGFGIKEREVTCIDKFGNEVNPDKCNDLLRKPKLRTRCNQFPCPYIWNTSPWSDCNVTCGGGSQTRKVVCQAVTKEGWLLPGDIPYGCSLDDKPPSTRICNHGECNATQKWVVGPWGSCTAQCGWGEERRLVVCVNQLGRRMSRRRCPSFLKPDHSQPCYTGPCYANSCRQLRDKTNIKQDDTYSLLLHGRLVQIYCKNMKRQMPYEYLSLFTDGSENFAEIYNERLQKTHTCPNNGTRMGNCTECRKHKYRRGGYTSYTKLRINPSTLQIQLTDSSYSETHFGRTIPFATAGDCYSSTGSCPQGRFNINLTRTGLVVSKNTTWVGHGRHSSKDIQILEGGEKVYGRCGGSCGTCSPELTAGLQLEVKR